MKRQIKFRGFNQETGKMTDWETMNKFKNFHKLLSLTFVDMMQFTGLTDRNGVDVYEGDRVSDHVGIGVVEYFKSGFRVNYNNGTYKWLRDYLKKEYDTLEVTGNIHEPINH